jgi:hypothetical protein
MKVLFITNIQVLTLFLFSFVRTAQRWTRSLRSSHSLTASGVPMRSNASAAYWQTYFWLCDSQSDSSSSITRQRRFFPARSWHQRAPTIMLLNSHFVQAVLDEQSKFFGDFLT